MSPDCFSSWSYWGPRFFMKHFLFPACLAFCLVILHSWGFRRQHYLLGHIFNSYWPNTFTSVGFSDQLHPIFASARTDTDPQKVSTNSPAPVHPLILSSSIFSQLFYNINRCCLVSSSHLFNYPTTFEVVRLEKDRPSCEIKSSLFWLLGYFKRHYVQKFNLDTMHRPKESLTTALSKSTFN